MFFLLSLLWFIRETKAILFYLYLWQLKEYHIGRFLDHFRTEKGKQLIFNKLLIFKIFLILIFLCGFFLFGFKVFPPPVFSGNLIFFFEFFIGIPFLVLILYIFEAVHSSFNFFQRKLKRPVWTLKTILLVSVAVILEIFFIITLSLYLKEEWGQINFTLGTFYLLLFDILTPLITSAIVLIFQPLAVLGRNQIIKKAKRKRESLKSLLVIGITGSYGKTSTKEFLATILSEKYKVLKTAEHQNSEVGISQCILDDLKPEHQIFVVEMGAYNRGGIKLLCDIVKPVKIGILTGINEQHMATFGSQENIIKTKYELIENLLSNGIAFFNGKNRYCRELYNKTGIKKFLYGEKARVFGEENLLAAIAVAKELGMTDEEIAKAVEKIENKLPGIQQKKGISGLIIFDATYSANPDGVLAHLEYLKTFPGRKIIVMPCLIELGPASKDVHKRIGEKIGEVCDLAIITTKDRFKEIKDYNSPTTRGAQQNWKGGGGVGVLPEGRAPEILFIEDPKEIFEKIKSFCQPGDVILLESRVPDELIKQLTAF